MAAKAVVGHREWAAATTEVRWQTGNQYLSEYLNLPFYQTYLDKNQQMYAAPRDVIVLNPL